MIGRGRQEEIPQALGFGFRLQLFEDRDDLPALAFGILRRINVHRRIDVRVHESDDAVAPVLLPFRKRKIHGVPLPGFERNIHRQFAIRTPT